MILKERRSGPVMFASEAREADRYGQEASYVDSTRTQCRYYFKDVASPTPQIKMEIG